MQYCDILLHAAHIVTQDEQGRILDNASLAIADGLVVGIGPRADMDALWQAARVMDMGNSLVLPGLINAHTHAAMTLLRGLADDMPLMDWLGKSIFPVEKQLTADLTRLGSLLG